MRDRRIKRTDIERWRDTAERRLDGRITANRTPEDIQFVPVWVKNDTLTDYNRYDCMALGDPVFDLEDGEVDLFFLAAHAAPDSKQPCILIEPISQGEYGRAIIFGLAIARVAATTLSPRPRFANPAAGSGLLTPIGGGKIRLLGEPSATAETVLPVLLGFGSGGITGLRVDGNNLQLEQDGVWSTWHTGTTC